MKTIKNYIVTRKFTKIYQHISEKASAKIIFLLDTSASMAVDKQLGCVKGIIQKTIASYPSKKIEYAIVVLENSSAKIFIHFSANFQFLL